jgi:hypothetical protein
MDDITKSKTREIIDNFAKVIKETAVRSSPPKEDVINFRLEKRDKVPRPRWEVPIELLLYRKDNGRIFSDVLNYEKNKSFLDEKTNKAQEIIRQFLEEKDEVKTKDLMSSIEHSGQDQPAIITCDGFLINGNRRKMVMEKLLKKYPGDPRFKTMKVVILPGKGEEGGPPTVKEIEEIENRYQLQSDGKAEYYAFDRALSMRHKISIGMTLEEQLRDDPIYANLELKEFKKEVQKFQDNYLNPLECVDRYLSNLGREGLYSTISKGLGDPEGRWQAFLDYYNFFYKNTENPKELIKLGIEEDEIGKIEDVAFKVIRMRQLRGLPGVNKVHHAMRELSKWLKVESSRKELLKLTDIGLEWPEEESCDKDGRPYSDRTIDQLWSQKHGPKINAQLVKVINNFEQKKDQETPINLLKSAFQKLTHESMKPDNIKLTDIPSAMHLAENIEKRARELVREFYNYQKEYNKLKEKHKDKH